MSSYHHEPASSNYDPTYEKVLVQPYDEFALKIFDFDMASGGEITRDFERPSDPGPSSDYAYTHQPSFLGNTFETEDYSAGKSLHGNPQAGDHCDQHAMEMRVGPRAPVQASLPVMHGQLGGPIKVLLFFEDNANRACALRVPRAAMLNQWTPTITQVTP
jgi:hypothetical protein